MTEYKKAYIDTAPFIYFMEGNENNEQYGNLVQSFFEDCLRRNVAMVTSVITLEEYSVIPYRDNELQRIETFKRLLATLGIEVVCIDREVAEKAAQIRAQNSGFKAMDALQLAAACAAQCDLFLTNDKQLKQFKDILVMTVDDKMK